MALMLIFGFKQNNIERSQKAAILLTSFFVY